jgi:hypothetical protein
MNRIIYFLLIQALISGSYLNAQKITLKSGSLGFLKGQKSLLVTYDYSNMAVGKYEKEADYVDLKTNEGNAAEPGKGDKWRQEWFGKRETLYEPSFEELFNKYAGKVNMACSKDAKDAAITMNVHTVFTDVGYYIGVSSKPSYISAEITFTHNSSAEKAVIFFEKCPGVGGIKEAYAKLGKSLADYLLKNM